MTDHNPFPAERVSKFGDSAESANLESLRLAVEELHEYLKNYATPTERRGGAVFLVGAHGSGKTHLLNHLGNLARGFTSISAGCVYALPDDPTLFGVYTIMVKNLGRGRIIELIDQARLAIARQFVERAKVTESVAPRIGVTADFQKLAAAGLIDQDAVEKAVTELLTVGDIPTDMVRALRLTATAAGDAAFAWLQGTEIADPASLGISRQLRQLAGTAPKDISADDLIGIEGLELIAALHRAAGVPFVLLVDQFQVLFARESDTVVVNTIRKLIENVSRQDALIFFAGSQEAWRRFPRDLGPRLMRREAIPVGDLNEREVRILLESFLKKRRETLPDETVAMIHELSGGSPREVLAIAYNGWQIGNGGLRNATREMLVLSAKHAGTLDDRRKIALKIADEVIAGYGSIRNEVGVTRNILVDRVVTKDGDLVVAMSVITVADAVQETDRAREIANKAAAVQSQLSGTPFIAVMVGYSSREVQQLVNQTANVIPFEERTFKNLLEKEMLKILSAGKKTDRVSEDTLRLILKRLDSLEAPRRDEAASAQQEFVRGTGGAAEEARSTRELKSRYELQEELDRIDAARKEKRTSDERDRMRGVLIANEAYRNDRVFDELGNLYLDVPQSIVDKLSERVSEMKEGILRDLRRRLGPPSMIMSAFARPNVWAVGAVLVIAAAIVAFSTLFYPPEEAGILGWKKEPTVPMYLTRWALVGLGAGMAVGMPLYVVLVSYTPGRYWRRRIAELVDDNRRVQSQT